MTRSTGTRAMPRIEARLTITPPPAALSVTTNGSGGVLLNWIASPDTVAGYHVYRAATSAGLFNRLTGSLITTTNYTDSIVSSNVYMVRAVKPASPTTREPRNRTRFSARRSSRLKIILV